MDNKGELESHSMIQFNAILPLINVMDIQCDDMLLNRKNLWSLFNINSLNQTFQLNLTKFECDWNNVNFSK